MDVPVEFLIRGARRETADVVREFATRRLAHAVGRLRHGVRRLTVRLVDQNGPRGGVDSRCSITVARRDGGRIFVEATAAWPFAAITLAAGRLGEALRRDVERRAHRRSARQKEEDHDSIS
jgi:ribosome-associated translation inhibitor RaiA